GKNDSLAVGSELRSEAGAPESRDLFRVRSVPIRDKQFHLHGRGEILPQKLLVALQLRAIRRMVRPPDDFASITREDRASVVADALRQPCLFAAIKIHRP